MHVITVLQNQESSELQQPEGKLGTSNTIIFLSKTKLYV
jgi:hypothetical protein